MGTTKDVSAFERGLVVGGRTLRFECVRNCNVVALFTLPVCIKNVPLPKGHPDNLTQLWEALESTWASIPVECFQQLVEFMPQHIEAVLRTKEGDIPNIWYKLCTVPSEIIHTP
jgi:hypothetical protein